MLKPKAANEQKQLVRKTCVINTRISLNAHVHLNAINETVASQSARGETC